MKDTLQQHTQLTPGPLPEFPGVFWLVFCQWSGKDLTLHTQRPLANDWHESMPKCLLLKQRVLAIFSIVALKIGPKPLSGERNVTVLSKSFGDHTFEVWIIYSSVFLVASGCCLHPLDLIFFFCFWDKISCSPGWPWTLRVVKAAMELWIYLPPPPKFGGIHHHPCFLALSWALPSSSKVAG